MRILVGHLYHESNTFCPELTRLDQFECHEGEGIIPMLAGCDVLAERGVEIVPTLYAARWSSGTVAREAYLHFEGRLLEVLRREKDALDGIWLSLHGGMTVEGIGSGEYRLLEAVRAVVGPALPIAVSLDMHANNRTGIEALANVMTGYHTAPHVDAQETQKKAVRALLRLIEAGSPPVHPALVRRPMLLIGERALSRDEPFKTLYGLCRAWEADSRLLAATLYVGMAWGDTPDSTVTAAVTPSAPEHAAFARRCAEELAEHLFARRNECAWAHPAYPPGEAVRRALESGNSPLYLSDAGDNPTAGGVGDGTLLLRLFLEEGTLCKRVLFAPILDRETQRRLAAHPPGAALSFAIGSGREPGSATVAVEGSVLRAGEVFAYHDRSCEKAADYTLVRAGGVDVILVSDQMAFTGMECFESVGVRVEEYDIVVLKMGYMFSEIAAPCRENMMAFTPGCTPLLITAEQYGHLPRPIWPLDDI